MTLGKLGNLLSLPSDGWQYIKQGIQEADHTSTKFQCSLLIPVVGDIVTLIKKADLDNKLTTATETQRVELLKKKIELLFLSGEASFVHAIAYNYIVPWDFPLLMDITWGAYNLAKFKWTIEPLQDAMQKYRQLAHAHQA